MFLLCMDLAACIGLVCPTNVVIILNNAIDGIAPPHGSFRPSSTVLVEPLSLKEKKAVVGNDCVVRVNSDAVLAA